MDKYTKGFWQFLIDSGHWKFLIFVHLLLIAATTHVFLTERSWAGLVFLVVIAVSWLLVIQHYIDRKNGRTR